MLIVHLFLCINSQNRKEVVFMKKKILIILIVICIIGGGLYYFFGRSSAENSSANILKVKQQVLKPDEITTKVSADGNIKTKNEKNVKIKINGLVKEVYIEEGDKVNKDDKIIQLEEEQLQKTLENAELNLREAKNNYNQLKNRFKNQNELNELKLKEANKNLEIAVLTRDKEKINLENKKHELKEQITESKNELDNLKSKLSNKEYLYNNGAIPEVELNNLRENYDKTKQKYESLKHKLEVLIEKTIPNTLNLANLKVENAINNLELLKTSNKNNQVTKNDIEAANIKVIKSKQEIENIESNLDKLLVSSPLSGTVVNMEIKAGDKVVEGNTVAKIADIENLIAEIMVDEIDINDIEIGQKAYITSDSFEERLIGEIVYTAPVSTKVGNINKYKTKVEIENNQGVVKPGMFVNAEIITNHKENVLTVPSIAVIGETQKYVYLNKEGKVGLKNLNKVEVRGIEAGSEVIIGPFTTLKALKDGTSVQNIDDLQERKGSQ